MLDELLAGQPPYKKQKIIPSAPVSTLILDGKRALDEKRYDNAVDYLSRAIENLCDRKADLLYLYDLRCGALIKLQKLDLALKDAKCMIRLDRADSRGYLKCAQVEQLRDNTNSAIKVCELGLKSVSSSDKGRPRLETRLLRIKETTQQNVIFANGTDPMEVLPSELLDIVLATFDYQQVVRIMGVCKAWRTRLRGLDIMTQSIDTTQAKRSVSYAALKAAFSRLGKTPKHLAWAKLDDNAAKLAASELQHWVKWESLRSLIIEDGKIPMHKLRFEKLPHLEKLCLSSGVHFSHDLNQLLKKCLSLRHVHLGGGVEANAAPEQHPGLVLESKHEKLRTLKINRTTCAENRKLSVSLAFSNSIHSSIGSFSMDIVEGVGNTSLISRQLPDNQCLFPQLESLELVNLVVVTQLNLSTYTNLRHFALRNASIDDRYQLRTPSCLECFTLEGPFANVFPQPEEIKFPAQNLTTISVKGSDSIRFLAYAIRQGIQSSRLRHLSITDFVTYTNVAGRFFENNLELLLSIPGKEALQEVEVLALRDDNIGNADHTPVLKLFPNVRHLDLESPRITEEFVSELIKRKENKLETVNLRNCTSVSQSIVAWSKARKVDVKFIRQSLSDAGGGRRVRYS